MKKLFILLLMMIPTQDSPIIVPIENPSFEQGAGWQFGPNTGAMQFNNLPVGYAGYGGAFSQTLAINPLTVQKPSPGWQYVTEGVYVLKFSVANYFPNYPGYYEAKISFGTQELCDTSGWGTRTFTEVTLACPSPGYLIVDKALPAGGPAQGSSDLAITFSAPGWTVLFDKVSLEFTPQ